jgi:hypothetical protein
VLRSAALSSRMSGEDTANVRDQSTTWTRLEAVTDKQKKTNDAYAIFLAKCLFFPSLSNITMLPMYSKT